MTELSEIKATTSPLSQAHEWVGVVLHHFAEAEQALGRLAIALELPTENGSLSSLNEVRNRLRKVGSRKCKALDKKIEEWSSKRPVRHLLAHSTVNVLFDEAGQTVFVTRHLPRDKDDVSPDRCWPEPERVELLKHSRADGRSISDHVRDLCGDPASIKSLQDA